MVICSLPHSDQRIYLCCDSQGEPYLLSIGVDSTTRFEISNTWPMAKYWLGTLKSKNWSRINLKPVEKAAIEKAIALLQNGARKIDEAVG